MEARARNQGLTFINWENETGFGKAGGGHRSEIWRLPDYEIDPVINVKGDAAVQRPLQVQHLMQQQRK